MKSPDNHPSFLLGVIDDEHPPENEPLLYYIMPEHQACRAIPRTDTLRHFFGSRARSDRYDRVQAVGGANPYAAPFALREKAYGERLKKALQGTMDKDIETALLGDELPPSLILLINSCEEPRFLDNDILNIMKVFRKRGARCTAYATKRAHGRAADVWQEADERYVLNATEIQWQADYLLNEADERIFDPSSTEEYREKLFYFFSENGNAPIQNKIASTLNDPVNVDAYIELSGAELREAGLAHESFLHVTTMQDHFTESTGWRPQVKKNAADPATFFFGCALGQQIQHALDNQSLGVPREEDAYYLELNALFRLMFPVPPRKG